MSSLSTRAKLLATVTAVGATAAVAGLGTFGTFTDTTTASTPVDSGIVEINLGTGAGNRLTTAAVDIVPGDTMQRAFTLNSLTTTDDLASITLTSTASPTSLLDTDATNGLQMVIEKCSVAWVEAGTTPAYTYSCAGTTSTVLASRAVIGSAIALSNLSSTTAGNTDNLRMTLTLPSTAGNTFQNLASTIAFAFTGTQRAAAAQ